MAVTGFSLNGVRSSRWGFFLLALAGTFVFAGAVGGTATFYLLDQTRNLAKIEAIRDIAEHAAGVERLGTLASLDVSAPLFGDSLAQIESAVETHFGSDRILRVKIWNPDGVVVYSTSPEQVGGTDYEEAGLRSAFAGDVWAEEPAGGKVSHEPDLNHVLEIYAPLYWSEELTPNAVIEVYLDYEPQQDLFAILRGKTLNALALIFLTLPIGLVVLYRVGWSQFTWEHNNAEQRRRETKSLNRMLQYEVTAALEIEEGLGMLHGRVQERYEAGRDTAHREHLATVLVDLDRLIERAQKLTAMPARAEISDEPPANAEISARPPE